MNVEHANAYFWDMTQSLFGYLEAKENSFCYGMVVGAVLTMLWKPLILLTVVFYGWVLYNQRS